MVKDSVCEKIAAGPSMKRYVLPCSCSRRIPVVAGQAGGAVTCPACGASMLVPRLGALERLEIEASAPTAAEGAGWNAAWACLATGVALLVLGAAAAGWLRTRWTAIAGIDEGRIRTVVESAGVESVHAAWLDYELKGLSMAALPEERRAQQQATALRGLEVVAWTAAAVGGVVTALAVCAMGWSKRHRGWAQG